MLALTMKRLSTPDLVYVLLVSVIHSSKSVVLYELVCDIIVTEEEIQRAGLLSNENNEHRAKCLVFNRHFTNIDLQHNKALRFIDMNDSKEVDEEGQGWWWFYE